jgi:hypothetical protein
MESCSPQATGQRCKPRRVGDVRYPSLPATSSRQSSAISSMIEPARAIWGAVRPKERQVPTRVFTSESHRGLS